MSLPPRFDVTKDQIRAVVEDFYARLREHPDLGPVFAHHVHDWTAHEEKITAFWCNAILGQGSYSGNPMQAHIKAGDVESRHFTIWLNIFDEVLRETLPAESAASWSHFAHRIGRGLSMGLDYHKQSQNNPPSLRG